MICSRYSKGGAAVQSQYRLVVRTVKERQQKAKKGASYPQLVKDALLCLPHKWVWYCSLECRPMHVNTGVPWWF